MPDRMLALRLLRWASRPELVEVDVPVPTGAEVLVRVGAAGLCQSDLHVVDAVEGVLPYALPFTLGHEIAGTVVRGGPDVDPAWIGTSVVVHAVWSCGHCRNCRRGRESYCLELAGGPVGAGLGRDGGMAEYVLVPDPRHLVATASLTAIAAAPLTDAGLTAHHAVRRHRGQAEGGTTLVIGVGGLGHLALQLLGTLDDAAVVAVDPRPDARELALRLGARSAVADLDAAVEALARLGRGPGADLVLDFVGSPATLEATPDVLAPGGTTVVVGSGGGRLEVAKGGRLAAGWSVDAPFWGQHADLVEVVGLAERGVIAAHTRPYPLDQALTALDDLRAGRVQGRAVVVP